MKGNIMKKLIFFLILIILITPLTGCFSDKAEGAGSNGDLEIDYLVEKKEDKENLKATSLLAQMREKLSAKDEDEVEIQIEEEDVVQQDKKELSFWEKLRLKNSEREKDEELNLASKVKEEVKDNIEIKPTENKKKDSFLEQNLKEKESKKEEEKKKEENSTKDNENKQKNEDKEPEEQKPKENTITITIRCDTAVNKGMHKEPEFKGIVPESGVILSTTTFKIKEGDTVLNVLEAARDKYKIQMAYRGNKESAYIEGINNLYEFDGGRWSGWMYCVNGWYPNYGAGVYVLQSGDVIEWNYTCDLGKDLGQEWLGN
ncbi:DUF4430 domain-containing protein [Tissierella sp.]|uniref:DUF4430 domain-containing protein n=1 Tax=Tissierella sp. TaxID=41274 RepID=UPI003026B6F4